MRRVRKWGGNRRASKRFTAALAQGFLQQLSLPEVAMLVEQIKHGIGLGHGSTAMENLFTNRHGSGVCDVLDAPAFHDSDSRRNSAGLPDGVAVVGRTLVMAEFKPMHGAPTPAQRRWLEALAQVEYVWSGVVRPDEWADFCDTLLAMKAEGMEAEPTKP
jgi:hypothetical protein